MGARQLRELVAGLRASRHPFLWVVSMPTPPVADVGGVHDGEEERASSHGMVVVGRWAPQAEVLAHRAVGGFVTHCGWNSVAEAAPSDMLLATGPLRTEKFLNAAFLVEVARVGVREVADRDAVVPAEAVAHAVWRLMGEDERAVVGRHEAES
jgi:UDP:flavonoid glycosyltransferase YjiC (YdhE family)